MEKTFIHDRILDRGSKKWILAKRYLRVRGTHDLETRQHASSAVGSLCSHPTMRSKISGGMEQGIAIPTKGLVRDWVSFLPEVGGRASGEEREQVLHIGFSKSDLPGNAHLEKCV